jgi:hypothetical protein
VGLPDCCAAALLAVTPFSQIKHSLKKLFVQAFDEQGFFDPAPDFVTDHQFRQQHAVD